jgi:hypothetical protein
MTSTQSDKQFLHNLYQKYYGEGRVTRATREVCIRCGCKRALGVRGHAKGLCKPCRKGGHDESVS